MSDTKQQTANEGTMGPSLSTAGLAAATPELLDVAHLIVPMIPAIIAMGWLTAEQTDTIRAAIAKATQGQTECIAPAR